MGEGYGIGRSERLAGRPRRADRAQAGGPAAVRTHLTPLGDTAMGLIRSADRAQQRQQNGAQSCGINHRDKDQVFDADWMTETSSASMLVTAK